MLLDSTSSRYDTFFVYGSSDVGKASTSPCNGSRCSTYIRYYVLITD
jgi:hypothetical protein